MVATIAPLHAQKRQVALELVLAIDTSASVDIDEFELQRQGLADAFAHPDLIAVIEGMRSTGIAVSVVEWSGTMQQDVIVDWTLVNSAQSSLQVSKQIREAGRAFAGLTDIGAAINHATDSISQNSFAGTRSVIDVSGDGASNTSDTAKARDRAVLLGITINGLVIFNHQQVSGQVDEVELIQHYSNQVIGGNGAFLMSATGFEDFRIAILNKLLREIIGTNTASLQFQSQPVDLYVTE